VLVKLALKGDSKGLKQLIASFALDINATTTLGRKTALWGAIEGGSVELAQWLLDHEADATINGSALLAAACSRGYEELVSQLLTWGLNLDCGDETNPKAEPPLWCAYRTGKESLWKLLLEEKADPNVCLDPSKGTLLQQVLQAGKEADAGTLLSYKADPTGITSGGVPSALHLAAARGMTFICQRLLYLGASKTSKDREGLIPLYCVPQGAGYEGLRTLLTG
jgi:ankyrin repeat protein